MDHLGSGHLDCRPVSLHTAHLGFHQVFLCKACLGVDRLRDIQAHFHSDRTRRSWSADQGCLPSMEDIEIHSLPVLRLPTTRDLKAAIMVAVVDQVVIITTPHPPLLLAGAEANSSQRTIR